MTIRCFLVGGAVRDFLKGNRNPHDQDFVMTGATFEDMVSMGFRPIEAQSFPVFHHPISNNEFALARTERKTGPGYHGFEVMFDQTVGIEEDLERRDLTVNAMAMEVPLNEVIAAGKVELQSMIGNSVIDPFDGYRDLRNKVLRPVSGAFREDPVRVLRAARFFAAWDGYAISPELGNMAREMSDAGELDHLTTERVWLETCKAMMTKSPARFFAALEFMGVRHSIVNLFNQNTTLFFTLVGEMSDELTLAQRFAKLSFFDKRSDEELISIYRSLGATNDVINLVRRTRAAKPLIEAVTDPEVIMTVFENANCIRDPLIANDIQAVMNSLGTVPSYRWSRMVDVLMVALEIRFEDLPASEQNPKDKSQIAQSIRRRRIDRIREVLA